MIWIHRGVNPAVSAHFRMILGTLFLLLLDFASTGYWRNSQNQEDCAFEDRATVGNMFLFANPYWPNHYKANTTCKWVFDCYKNYICRLRCDPLWLPQSNNCSVDGLTVSDLGRSKLRRKFKLTFCGRSAIDVSFNGSKLALELRASSNSPGGRFKCSVRTESLYNAKYLRL